MKDRFILEIERGKTNCNNCPFGIKNCLQHDRYVCNVAAADAIDIDCSEYDLNTIKVIEKIEE